MFRTYTNLRCRIVPYSYSAALEAALTSMSIVRGMPLAFPEKTETADSITQYMYVSFMLISAFADHVYLVRGRWYDMWKGEELEGGRWIDYAVPENRGGGFFLKEGAIIPTWAPRQYIGLEYESHMELLVYAGENHDYVFYEDDGDTSAYRKGEYASTRFDLSQADGVTTLVIHPREGRFNGMCPQVTGRLPCSI